MTPRSRKFLIGLYAAIGVFTFSWAASDPGPIKKTCDYATMKFPYDTPDEKYHITCTTEQGRNYGPPREIAGVTAGLLWPLYWSWTSVDYMRKTFDLHNPEIDK